MGDVSTRQVDALLDHLRRRWDHLFRLTTVEQAMRALGLPLDARLRRAVADHLAARPEIHPVVRRWGYRTLVLNASEKLLARRLSLQPAAAWNEAAAALDLQVSPARLRAALAMLGHVGFLEPGREAESRASPVARSPSLVPAWAQRAGPRGFAYHTVRLADGEEFDVPCARDVLLLVAGRHPWETVRLADACGHCPRRIAVRFERARVAAAAPGTVGFFRGGT